ncbi:MAG: lipase family protein [Nostoc desertorum CM1-VF14]|jgi:hypothetical protein|nr:lipase family protein [Nostoc desertorum CM1-VF14]
MTVQDQTLSTLSEKQTTWALGWLINEIATEEVLPSDDHIVLPNPAQKLEDLLAHRIDFYLKKDPKLTEFIGEWERVWGPFVYLAPPPFNQYATNAIFVAKQDNKYVISIAGTNPNSLHNWLIEDLYVAVQADWGDYAGTDPLLPAKISMGTKIGLDNLLRPHPGSSTTIIDFLTDLLKEASEKIEITVTGASLGGALSPVLALALKEKKTTWDPDGQATLKVVTFAAPTPGNLAFAQYYSLRLGNTTTRVWNSLDIVPHAWNTSLLSQLPSLYAPEISFNPLIDKYVKIAKALSILGNYTHLIPNARSLKGTFRPIPIKQNSEKSSKQVELDVQSLKSLKSAQTQTQETQHLSVSDEDIERFGQFLQQAVQQHIYAYFDLLEFPSELTEFLTDKEQLPPGLRLEDAQPKVTKSVVSKLLEYSANPDVEQ